jgi:hypothetical protein
MAFSDPANEDALVEGALVDADRDYGVSAWNLSRRLRVSNGRTVLPALLRLERRGPRAPPILRQLQPRLAVAALRQAAEVIQWSQTKAQVREA